MALIIDPDSLVRSTSQVNAGTDGNIWIDTATLTFRLREYLLLDSGGVSLQAIYSYLKEEWKTDAELIKYPFPMVAITPEQFEFVNGWTYEDQATVDLFRNGGFAVKNAGVSEEEFIGVITLGSIGAGDQVYFQQVLDGASTDIVLTGPVNQCIKVYGDGAHGSFDYRSYLKLFVREQAKKYGTSSHTDIGVTTFTYQAYRFPLANSADLKVVNNDVTADAYGVGLEYFGAAQSRTIGAGSYDFSIIIDGNGRTAEEIYEAVQSKLRKAIDIDDGAGSVIGKTADDLLTFVGETLVTSTGVYIDNFQATDTNRLQFYDDIGTLRTFPYVAAGSISFNNNLVNDGGAIYRMYYTTGFGTAGATLVQDNGNTDISGNIAGGSVSFDYDYDNDAAGGGAGIDKNVTVVAIGLGSAQYVVATGTITRSTANSISLVASLERNYSNPV